MSVRIDGLSELSEMLTQESVRTAKRYLVNCAKPAADVVIEAMKETVPVGVTGRLDEELGYQTRFDGSGDGTTLTVNIGPARSTWWGSWPAGASHIHLHRPTSALAHFFTSQAPTQRA